jgi:ribosomal protein S18 acetylase RimI-like enzyme
VRQPERGERISHGSLSAPRRARLRRALDSFKLLRRMFALMETLFQTVDCYASLLSAEDGKRLQSLCERCADYYELVEGNPPNSAAAQSLFYAVPDGKGSDDKLLIGLFTITDQLIGVVDIIRDYPEDRTWYVGLLLIEPAYRSKGIGTVVYRALEDWAVSCGARQIRLSVLEENERAYSFWEQIGFEEIERQGSKMFGDKEHRVIVMKREAEGFVGKSAV